MAWTLTFLCVLLACPDQRRLSKSQRVNNHCTQAGASAFCGYCVIQVDVCALPPSTRWIWFTSVRVFMCRLSIAPALSMDGQETLIMSNGLHWRLICRFTVQPTSDDLTVIHIHLWLYHLLSLTTLLAPLNNTRTKKHRAVVTRVLTVFPVMGRIQWDNVKGNKREKLRYVCLWGWKSTCKTFVEPAMETVTTWTQVCRRSTVKANRSCHYGVYLQCLEAVGSWYT